MNTTTHFNGLTEGEAERLAMLAEECGEIVQMVGKVLRHGYDSSHPDGGLTNRNLLRAECRDAVAVINMMTDQMDFDGWDFRALSVATERKLKYSHHQ